MKFNITIDRDEDGVYVAECPSIPGCLSQGQTKQEALINIREAIELLPGGPPGEGNAADRRDGAGGGQRLMPQPPPISGREAVRTFEKFGWLVARQKASHIILTQSGEIASLSIPDHKEVAKGSLRGLIRNAGLTIDQFIQATKTN